MRAPLTTIAADLAEASDLLVGRIERTMNAPSTDPGDDIAREASLYAASALIWSVRRPGSAVGDDEGVELLVHWLAAFLPHYKNEPEVFFKAAERRAAQYIVLWEHAPDAAGLNAARFFSEVVDRAVTDEQTAELAEVLNTARNANDAFIQAAFAP
jgi:hypothetical protein